MDASAAKRELRRKHCTCGKGGYYGPHEQGCPKYVDRSAAKEIRETLARVRHPENEGEWISLAEFHRIDLFAFRCWQDWPDASLKGRTGIDGPFYRRVGYEIKTSRSDFRYEIRNPRKRGPAMAFTHQFFFACPPGLIKKAEVPDDCGLVYVEGDQVTQIKRAPIRRPESSFTTGDIVAMLRAEHLGPDAYDYRQTATRLQQLIDGAQERADTAGRLLERARVSMLRTHGHLLVAGSEWIGPWPWRMLYGHRKQREEVRVRITHVNVANNYGDMSKQRIMNAHNGTVRVKSVEQIEADGHDHSGDWVDPGDFLIAYRHESEPRETAVKESRARRPGDRFFSLVRGGAADAASATDEIEF